MHVHVQGDVYSVALQAPDGVQNAQPLSIYLSSTTPFNASNAAVCMENVTFPGVGGSVTAVCGNTTGRYMYVTKASASTQAIALATLQPFVDGEYQAGAKHNE